MDGCRCIRLLEDVVVDRIVLAAGRKVALDTFSPGKRQCEGNERRLGGFAQHFEFSEAGHGRPAYEDDLMLIKQVM